MCNRFDVETVLCVCSSACVAIVVRECGLSTDTEVVPLLGRKCQMNLCTWLVVFVCVFFHV